MSVENRKHERYAAALQAEVTLGFETLGAATENISAGGVALILDAPIDEGKQLDVTLILTQDGIEDPFEEPFDIRGVVAWCGPRDDGAHTVGLRFVQPSDAQRARLERFLEQLT